MRCLPKGFRSTARAGVGPSTATLDAGRRTQRELHLCRMFGMSSREDKERRKGKSRGKAGQAKKVGSEKEIKLAWVEKDGWTCSVE
jgi:hypothetical protein